MSFHGWGSIIRFYFLPSSLFPPVISSVTILSLGLNYTTVSTSPIQQKLVFTWSLACRAHFLRFFEEVISLFTQREIPTAIFASVDCDWIRDIFKEIVVAHKWMRFCYEIFPQEKTLVFSWIEPWSIEARNLQSERSPSELASPPLGLYYLKY